MTIRTSSLLDNSCIMGSGTFGKVCLAEVTINDTKMWTAAKTIHGLHTKQETALRSLLIEIKILLDLGDHENITRLVAVYTADTSSGMTMIR